MTTTRQPQQQAAPPAPTCAGYGRSSCTEPAIWHDNDLEADYCANCQADALIDWAVEKAHITPLEED